MGKIFSLTDDKMWAEYFNGLLREARTEMKTENVPCSISTMSI
jgi:hypothetical protein